MIDAPAPTEVIYIGPSTDEAGVPLLTTRTIHGAELRRRIEDATGKPFKSLPSTPTSSEAQTLAAVLMN